MTKLTVVLPWALGAGLLASAPVAAEFQYSDAPLRQPPILSPAQVARVMADLDHFLTAGQVADVPESLIPGKDATDQERVFYLIDSILKARRADGRSELSDFERTSLATLFDTATRLGSYGTGLIARHFAEGEAGMAPPLLPADPIELRLEFPSYLVTSRLAPWRIQFPYYFMLLEAKRIFTESGIATDNV
jgi:hypothetical protein